MNIQQRTTFTTFITIGRDEVHVRLADAVEERLDAHRRRHRDDRRAAASACTRRRPPAPRARSIIDGHEPRQEREAHGREERAGHEAEEDGVREHRARGLAVALGVAPRDERLRADADGAEAPAEGPEEDERRQERGLRVGRLGDRQVREVDDVDLVDDALREHREHRRQREPEDRLVAVAPESAMDGGRARSSVSMRTGDARI